MPDLLLGAAQDLAVAERALRAQDDALFAAQVGLDVQALWYRELFDGLPTATLVTTPDGAVTHANTAACLLLGRPPNAVVGRAVGSFVVDGGRAALDHLLALTRQTADVVEFAVCLVPQDGAAVDCRVWARAVGVLGSPSLVLVWTLAPLIPPG
jgi:PAS domain S-box-containing protein